MSSVQRLAWAMGRPAAAPAAVRRAAAGLPGPSMATAGLHDPARRVRLVQALGRLAADTTATDAERALAEQRLAELRTAAYAQAC